MKSHVIVMDGLRIEFSMDHTSISEVNTANRADFDKDGTIESSTFGPEADGFLLSYYRRIRPLLERIHGIDRKYAHA